MDAQESPRSADEASSRGWTASQSLGDSIFSVLRKPYTTEKPHCALQHVTKGPSSAMSLPAFAICFSDWGEMKSQYSLNLHFPDG